MFVYLVNELSSSPSLGSTIIQANLKHDNVIMNKLESIRFNLYIFNIICFYVYMYKNLLI